MEIDTTQPLPISGYTEFIVQVEVTDNTYYNYYYTTLPNLIMGGFKRICLGDYSEYGAVITKNSEHLVSLTSASMGGTDVTSTSSIKVYGKH